VAPTSSFISLRLSPVPKRRVSPSFAQALAAGALCLGFACSSPSTADGTGGTPTSTGGGQGGANVANATGGALSGGSNAAGGASSGAGTSSNAGMATGGASTSGGGASTGGTPGTGGSLTGNGGTTTATGGVAGNASSGGSGGVNSTSGGNAAGGANNTGGVGTAGGGTAGMTSQGGAGGGKASGCSTSGPGYYVDSSAGDDAKDGKSPATAWKSLTKVNAITLKAGDNLCFRAGGSWTGQLKPLGSGSAASPIVIDQYGTGAKPRFAAGASDKETVSLVNQSYIELNNLEVTNQKSALGDYRGILVLGRDAGTLNHITIRNCFVHDVTGEVNWIGGDVADNATGVTFETGWDASKRTGGIVFEVASSAAQPVKTKFNEVVVENNVVKDCSFGGIIFKQLDATVHWGIRSSASDTTFTPHTNVVVRNNYINQHNTAYGCNAVYMTGVQNGTIENNVVAEAGTSGIELYYTDSVTIQHNETYGTIKKAGGADSNGIDTDKATTKSIIQYNYIHDNGDGILLCQFSFGDSIVRYNILQNNSRYQLYLHSDSRAVNATYNNTFYNDKYNASIAYGYGDSLAGAYVLTNNIFVSTKTNAVLTTGGGIKYQNNLYFGASVTAAAGDTHPISADPKLTNPGKGTNGSEAGPAFASLTGYQLGSGSGALNAGATMTNNGGQDFWGNKLYTGGPDIGAHEAP
jgi:hypothetical protein